MTIGSSNISFSTIASEKSIATSNMSLKDLSDKEVKTNLANGTSQSSDKALVRTTLHYGSTNATRGGGTVTSAQGTGSAGLNTTPYSMSEWAGYDPVANHTWGNSSNPVVEHRRDLGTSNSCTIPIFTGLEIWCQKSGSNIYIYGGGQSGLGIQPSFNNNGSITTTGANQVLATITTSTTGMLPTGCTMSYSTVTNSATGTVFGSGAYVQTISGGTNSTTNLGATKVGYKFGVNTQSEGANNNGGSVTFRIQVQFNWTFPSGPSGTTYNNTFHGLTCETGGSATHGSGFDQC